MAQRRGGLGPRGGQWVAAAAATHVHDAEVVDDERLAVPAGTPALLSREEAEDVLEVLDAVAAATQAGPGRARCEELALVLRQRLRGHPGS
ncbi:hypothetical protein [Nocardiopsis ganjiahuensis]|uniref:hypothetical protein n=1 Tax=Nocardiopsis ganjiahuensis TaxID=239984 RepID=UPI000345B137|nr:hypothetical protein [Nocardiopsis ganjiahuensis]